MTVDSGPVQSPADGWDAIRHDLERKRRPRPPRGELTEAELREFLRCVSAEMRRARYEAGLTQDQVAEMMDTTRSAVSRLEKLEPNVPSLTTLCRYANAIDCRLQIRLESRRTRPAWCDG